MTAPLRHVNPGEPFKPHAATWNAFVDTARTVGDKRVIFQPGPLLATSNDGLIFGRATSAIAGAVSPLSPTAFTFREFLTDDATVTPHTQIEATEDTPGVNEWPDGASVDAIVCMSYTKGEWHLVSAREACAT